MDVSSKVFKELLKLPILLLEGKRKPLFLLIGIQRKVYEGWINDIIQT